MKCVASLAAERRHRGEAPDGRGERIAEAGAELVDQPAEDEIADRVGELEGEDDVGVGGFVPAIFALQRRLEDADHLPVDIIDRGGEEEQRANAPAHAADVHFAAGRLPVNRRRPFLVLSPIRLSSGVFRFVWETGVIYNPAQPAGGRYADR